MDVNELIEKLREMSMGMDTGRKFLIESACRKLELYQAQIAELESQVVRMRYHDDQITERRVFEIEFSKFLHPEEAMDIFVRNMKRIFERNDDYGR